MDENKKKVVSQSGQTTTKDIPDGKVETTRRSSIINNEDGSTSYVSHLKEKIVGSSRIGEPQKVEEYNLGVSMEDTKYVDIIRTKDDLAILQEEKLITYIKVKSFERVLQLMKESLDTYFDSLSFGIYSSEEIIEFRNSIRIEPPKKERYTKNFDLYLSEEAQLNRFKRMGENMFLNVQREVDRIREEEEERLRKEKEENELEKPLIIEEEQENEIKEGKEEDELEKPLIIAEEEERTLSNNFINIKQELKIEYLPENTKNYDLSIKVIFLGDSNVGKTSIINCLQTDSNLQKKTTSIEFFNYIIKINNVVIRMQIWDTVGQEKFNSITKSYYKTTDVVILVYAINDINSFNNLTHWNNELNDKSNIDISKDSGVSEETKTIKNENVIKVLVGNKKDLEKERQVTYEQGEKFRKNNNFDFFEEIKCNSNVILNDSSYYSYKENNSVIKENNDKSIENDIHSDNNNDKDYVKQLFDKIGKEIYQQCMNHKRSKVTSSTYNYEASESMLEIREEKEKEKEKEKEIEKSSSCCC